MATLHCEIFNPGTEPTKDVLRCTVCGSHKCTNIDELEYFYQFVDSSKYITQSTQQFFC